MAYPWQARHGLTAAQYQSEFDSLLAQGYRLIDLNGYNVNGVERYAAIWEQSPGPDWQARHGLSSTEHQELFLTLTTEGYRPIIVSGYEIGGSAHYASLWQRINGTEWYARHGITASELQAEYDVLTPQGFHPIDICGYTVAGQTRFAAIWENSPIAGWVARHGLTAAEYQSQFDYWVSQGYTLWRVSGYEVAGVDYYAAIWFKGPTVTWQARHGLTAATYQSEFDALLQRGFHPVKVNGYSLRGQARFAAIWHNPYFSHGDLAFIENAVNTFMTNYNVPGASLALTYQGRLVFAQSFGLADRSVNEAVTTNHRFRIASISKPITAVAIFRLIDSGRLNLGDRVFGTGNILGTTYGTTPYGANMSQITVQNLLEHTSGWASAQDPMFGHFELDQEGLIDWMLDNEPLTHVPGTIFEYLNFGYCVLGRVIEAVSGLSYAAYVQQQVLSPCGITNMQIAGDTLADRRPNEVVYYPQGTPGPYTIRVSRMDAHGGWIATPTDLLRFLVRVNGFPSKADILSPTSIPTMFTPTTAVTPDGDPVGYAKGWVTNTLGNHWHDGDLPGTAGILVSTSGQFGWAVLVNSRDDSRLNAFRADLDNLMWTIVRAIPNWPDYDLF